jgi:hypothetical protein
LSNLNGNPIAIVALSTGWMFFAFKLSLVATTAIQHSNLEHQYQLS